MSTFITKRAKELGLRKVDARHPLEIEVSHADIARGSRKDPGQCALVRACKRTYKVDNAYFFKTSAWLEHDGCLVRYSLPESLQKEIFAFDRARAMEPGIYRLAKPGKSSSLDAKNNRNRRPSREQIRAEMAERINAKRPAKRAPWTAPRDIRGYELGGALDHG